MRSQLCGKYTYAFQSMEQVVDDCKSVRLALSSALGITRHIIDGKRIHVVVLIHVLASYVAER